MNIEEKSKRKDKRRKYIVIGDEKVTISNEEARRIDEMILIDEDFWKKRTKENWNRITKKEWIEKLIEKRNVND